jgi:hypothetical protein
MQLQMQQQLASRQAAKGTKMMATPLAASSRPLMVRAPAQKAMGAGLKHVAGAAQTAEQRNVVVKAIENGVSAPGPATPLNVVFISAEVSLIMLVLLGGGRVCMYPWP